MADKKISQLTGASTPLAGTEVLPIVQSGSTVKVSAANVTAGRAVSALTYTSTATTGTAPFTVSSTTQVANLNSATAGTAENLKSNATTGVIQIAGPAAASTRVMTTPDANFTVARTDAGQTFTGNQTISSGNLVVGTAANGISFTSGGFIASAQGQITASGGTTTTFVTLANANENRTYAVSVRQSGAGVNFVFGFAISYGSSAIIKRIVQDNTNPVVDMDLTNTGLALNLAIGAGFGSTTWDYIVTRLS